MKSDTIFYSDIAEEPDSIHLRDKIDKENTQLMIMMRNDKNRCIAKVTFDKSTLDEFIFELMKIKITMND